MNDNRLTRLRRLRAKSRKEDKSESRQRLMDLVGELLNEAREGDGLLYGIEFVEFLKGKGVSPKKRGQTVSSLIKSGDIVATGKKPPEKWMGREYRVL